jgi:hypothetical protein
MKSFNKIVIFLLLLPFAFSCKKQDLPAKPQPSPFSVTVQNAATVPAGGGKVMVDIKAGSDGWWLTIPPEAKAWSGSSQLFGSGDKTITLTFSANATGSPRSVMIQFNPTFDLPVETISFQQSQ